MTGAQERRRRLAAARARDPLDADAEQRGRRRAPRRSSRMPSRTSPASVSSVTRTRSPSAAACGSRLESGALPRDRRRPRRRAPGCAHERRPAQPRLRRAVTSRSTGCPETFVALGYDPQTAGGLLVSLPGRAGRGARGGVRVAEALRPPGRPGRGGPGVVVELSSPGDDPRAVSALSQRPPRVPEGRGGARDELFVGITNPDPRRIRPEDSRSAAPSARVESVQLRRAAADGEGGRRRRGARARPRARDPVPGQRARALAGLRARRT